MNEEAGNEGANLHVAILNRRAGEQAKMLRRPFRIGDWLPRRFRVVSAIAVLMEFPGPSDPREISRSDCALEEFFVLVELEENADVLALEPASLKGGRPNGVITDG